MSDEQREAALEWLRNYHGSIDSTALMLAHEAGQRLAKAEPVQIDRLPITKAQIEEILRSNDVYEPDPDSGGWRLDVSVAAAAIIVALADQPGTGTVEWGLSDSMLDTFPKPHFTASEECVRRNQQRGHPAIKVVRRTVTDWEEIN